MMHTGYNPCLMEFAINMVGENGHGARNSMSVFMTKPTAKKTTKTV